MGPPETALSNSDIADVASKDASSKDASSKDASDEAQTTDSTSNKDKKLTTDAEDGAKGSGSRYVHR